MCDSVAKTMHGRVHLGDLQLNSVSSNALMASRAAVYAAVRASKHKHINLTPLGIAPCLHMTDRAGSNHYTRNRLSPDVCLMFFSTSSTRHPLFTIHLKLGMLILHVLGERNC